MCCESSAPTSAAPAPVDNTFTDTLAGIAKDRNERAKKVFDPLEDQAVGDVQKFQTQDYQNQQVGKATADVASGFDKARASEQANEESLGVNPSDGSHGFMARGLSIAQAGGEAAAATGARERAQTTAFDTLAGMSGRGDAKIGQSIGAATAGGNQAMQSQANQIGWNENQQQQSNQGMAGIGSLVGMGLSMFSSKKAKTAVKPVGDALAAVRKVPVKSWQYKNAAATGMSLPGGRHVGPMAEDMKAATGRGNGMTLELGDQIGTVMAAVKQLDKKVSSMKGARA